MASITPRNGAYRVTVRLPGGQRETATFDTHEEAKAWADSLEQKKAVGALTGSAGAAVKVAELLTAYEAAVCSKRDSARWDALRIAKWQNDPLARLAVASVTTHDINEWAARREAQVSGSTVNRELTLLSGAFSYAMNDRKWIKENPCRGARRPEDNPPRDHRLLTPEQLLAIERAGGLDVDPDLVSKAARATVCFLVGLETGMRSGEILRVKPDDYVRESRYVHVTATERGGRKSARSGRSTRTAARKVPLTERGIELFDWLLRTKPADSIYIVGLNDSQRDANWRKVRDRAGIDDLHFHDSKHEACTRLSSFLDVFELSHAVGTKDIVLLRDTYYSKDVERAASRLPPRLTPVAEKRPD